MTDPLAVPAPASHDRSVPTGALEESSATLFEAMLAARDAEDRGEPGALTPFYRALAESTLLLPVPPGTQEQANASLAAAVSDREEVEIGVMLARDGEGKAVNVIFASGAALAAWSPAGTGTITLPARVVLSNMAASRLPAILDPAGPIPYRFEPDEIAALAAGRIPGTDEELFGETGASSVRVRLASGDTAELETAIAKWLVAWRGLDAYIVDSARGETWRTTVGVAAREEAGNAAALAAARGLADDLRISHPDVEVVVLSEPMLTQVRALTEPVSASAARRRSG